MKANLEKQRAQHYKLIQLIHTISGKVSRSVCANQSVWSVQLWILFAFCFFFFNKIELLLLAIRIIMTSQSELVASPTLPSPDFANHAESWALCFRARGEFTFQ